MRTPKFQLFMVLCWILLIFLSPIWILLDIYESLQKLKVYKKNER